MRQTPFQEPDTILFNPHDISQREVMILHIFHRRLRLRYVKVVHGGVQQRGLMPISRLPSTALFREWDLI